RPQEHDAAPLERNDVGRTAFVPDPVRRRVLSLSLGKRAIRLQSGPVAEVEGTGNGVAAARVYWAIPALGHSTWTRRLALDPALRGRTDDCSGEQRVQLEIVGDATDAHVEPFLLLDMQNQQRFLIEDLQNRGEEATVRAGDLVGPQRSPQ